MKFHGVVGKATGKIPIANSMYPSGLLDFLQDMDFFFNISSRDSGVIHWMLQSMPNAKNDIPSGQQDMIYSSILHSVRDSNPCRNVFGRVQWMFIGRRRKTSQTFHTKTNLCYVLFQNVQKTRHLNLNQHVH